MCFQPSPYPERCAENRKQIAVSPALKNLRVREEHDHRTVSLSFCVLSESLLHISGNTVSMLSAPPSPPPPIQMNFENCSLGGWWCVFLLPGLLRTWSNREEMAGHSGHRALPSPSAPSTCLSQQGCVTKHHKSILPQPGSESLSSSCPQGWLCPRACSGGVMVAFSLCLHSLSSVQPVSEADRLDGAHPSDSFYRHHRVKGLSPNTVTH